MAKKVYDQDGLDMQHTNWSGDAATGGLPVSGRLVENYVKSIDEKATPTEELVGDKICNFITYWFTVTYNVYQRAVLNLVSFWYHYITFVIISLNFISYIFLLYF